ncbi:MAG: hypothetical protein LBD06_10345, partial [Candidatus Accumulibacter sp.]|nr:hypothetical protein [Accumulibacter sp.]
LYGHYRQTHQGSDTVTLSTGEPVKFDAVESRRTLLGIRWNQSINPSSNFFLGAAWGREYDGKVRASIYGNRLDTPKLQGDSTLVEAGFTLTPGPSHPLSLDFGIQGYAGKQEGVTGSFRLNYRF